MNPLTSWQFWAFASAVFAALTAVFAKIGIEGITSNYATFIRTVIILLIVSLICYFSGEYKPISSLSKKCLLFLILSGIATGASWLCYFKALHIGEAAKVAPIDKLSVVLVAVFGVVFLGESLSVINWIGIACIAGGSLLILVK